MIKGLSEEQIQNWSRTEKDRWWLENVFRGDMPQLTLRSGLTGFVLGGLLSATNLYVGAKSGWTLGVGLTSVILAFAMFKLLARIGARDMTILENNCTQSIATAAGYMTGPLISGMAAYMWIQNQPMLWWQMLWFNVVLSILGVLVAFPMKRRFINDEQQPFPEGRACGVVLDTLYSSAAAVGLFKAKALAMAAALAGTISFISGEAYLKALHAVILMLRHGETWKGTFEKFGEQVKATWHLPHHIFQWYYDLAQKHNLWIPKLAGVDVRQLGLTPALDLALFGAGGLMGIRAASSMLLGMLVNFTLIVPIMIAMGEIKPMRGSFETGTAVFTRTYIINEWALWWGIVIMVTASMVSLFARPDVFRRAFEGLFRGRSQEVRDPIGHIELPLWVSWVGIPVVGAVGVWMAHEWFGVGWVFGATAIPLIIVLTLIAASSTAMTGITPTGSLSKIPQFLFGSLDPKHAPTNIMTGVMCVEVAGNASNLLMDIKPGYMLGAKPRQQAIGHCIGIVAGALASTPLFYLLFLNQYDSQKAAENPNHVQEIMAPDGGQFGFPSALQWKGVSDLVTSIFDGKPAGAADGPVRKELLTQSIIYSMVIAAIFGLVLELARTWTRGRFPINPLAIGLGVVVPPESTMAMFAGAFFFWLMNRIYSARTETTGHKLWVATLEPICAGIVAGAALIGIGDAIVLVTLPK